MSNLEPCPFCGGKVNIIPIELRQYGPIRNRSYGVVCWVCNWCFGYDEDSGDTFNTEDEAAEAWNRRVSNCQEKEEDDNV